MDEVERSVRYFMLQENVIGFNMQVCRCLLGAGVAQTINKIWQIQFGYVVERGDLDAMRVTVAMQNEREGKKDRRRSA